LHPDRSVTSYELVYVGFSQGTLYRTLDAPLQPDRVPANKWFELPNPPWGKRTISSIATVPHHAGMAFLTIGNFVPLPFDPDVNKNGQVYFTADYGVTWKNISGDNRALPTSLPNLPAWSIAVQDESADLNPVVYVGNDAGVW